METFEPLEYNPAIPNLNEAIDEQNDIEGVLENIPYSEYVFDEMDIQTNRFTKILCKKKIDKYGRKMYLFIDDTSMPTSNPSVIVVFFKSMDTYYININNVTLPIEDFLRFQDTLVVQSRRHTLPNHQIRADILPADEHSLEIRTGSGKTYTVQNLSMDFFLAIIAELSKDYPVEEKSEEAHEESVSENKSTSWFSWLFGW